MTDDTERDWRESAYLSKENWPEAIPNDGPKREYGPYTWGRISHEDPNALDDYPASHPDAASVGDVYLGDVCPYCGVPLAWTEQVVLLTGESGIFGDVDDLQEPTPAYHTDCWEQRREEGGNVKGTKTLEEYA